MEVFAEPGPVNKPRLPHAQILILPMLLFFWLSIIAPLVYSLKLNSKKCALELQGILYRPITPQFEYMKRVMAAFPVHSPVVWGVTFDNPTNPSFTTLMMDYLTQYNLIAVYFTFQTGQVKQYSISGAVLTVSNLIPLTYPLDMAQANVAGVGFNDYNPIDIYFDYTITAFGPEAKFLYITIEYDNTQLSSFY